jgi:hypothetical protein
MIIKWKSTIFPSGLAPKVVILSDRLPVPSFFDELQKNLIRWTNEISFSALFEPEAAGIFLSLFLGITELTISV